MEVSFSFSTQQKKVPLILKLFKLFCNFYISLIGVIIVRAYDFKYCDFFQLIRWTSCDCECNLPHLPAAIYFLTFRLLVILFFCSPLRRLPTAGGPIKNCQMHWSIYLNGRGLGSEAAGQRSQDSVCPGHVRRPVSQHPASWIFNGRPN